MFDDPDDRCFVRSAPEITTLDRIVMWAGVTVTMAGIVALFWLVLS